MDSSKSNDVIILDEDVQNVDDVLEKTFPFEALNITITKLLASDASSTVNVGPFLDMILHEHDDAQASTHDFFEGNLHALHPYKAIVSNNVSQDDFDIHRFCLEWNSDERRSYTDRERMSYNLLRSFDKETKDPYFYSVNPTKSVSVYVDNKQFGAMGTIESVYPGDKLFIIGLRNPNGEHEFDVKSYLADLRALKKGNVVTVVFNTFVTYDGMLISEINGLVKDATHITLDKPVSIKLMAPTTQLTIPSSAYGGYYIFGEGTESFSKSKICDVILSSSNVEDSAFIMDMVIPSPDEVFTREIHKHEFFNTIDFELKSGTRVTSEILHLLKAVLVDTLPDVQQHFMESDPKKENKRGVKWVEELPNAPIPSTVFEASELPPHKADVVPILQCTDTDTMKDMVVATRNGFFEFKDGHAIEQKKYAPSYVYNVNTHPVSVSYKQRRRPINVVSILSRKPILYNPQYFIEKKYSGDINVDGEYVPQVEDPDIESSAIEIEPSDYSDIPNFEQIINSFVIDVFTEKHPEIVRVCEIVNLLVKQFTEMYFKSKHLSNKTLKAPSSFWLSNATYNSLMDVHENNEILVIKTITIIIKSYILVCVRALIKFKEFHIIGMKDIPSQNEVVQRIFEQTFGLVDIDPKFVNSLYTQILKYDKMLKGIVSKEASIVKFIAPFNETKYKLDKWVNFRPRHDFKFSLPRNVQVMTKGEFAMVIENELKNDERYHEYMDKDKDNDKDKGKDTKTKSMQTIFHAMVVENGDARKNVKRTPRQLTKITHHVPSDLGDPDPNDSFKTFMHVNGYKTANVMFTTTPMNVFNKNKLLNSKIDLKYLTRYIRNEIPVVTKGRVIVKGKHLIENMKGVDREEAIIHAILGSFEEMKGDHTIVLDMNSRLEQTIMESELNNDAIEKKFDKLREKHNAFVFNMIDSLPKDARLIMKELLDNKLVEVKVDMMNVDTEILDEDEDIFIDAEDNE